MTMRHERPHWGVKGSQIAEIMLTHDDPSDINAINVRLQIPNGLSNDFC